MSCKHESSLPNNNFRAFINVVHYLLKNDYTAHNYVHRLEKFRVWVQNPEPEP